VKAAGIETRMSVDFGKIGFSGTLRPSQVASSRVIMKELESSSSEETQLLGLGKNGINLPARDSRFIEL